MLNIKNTLSFAAIACGLLIIFAAPQKAPAQIPPGSYLKTCDVYNVDASKGTLLALCKKKNEKKKLNRDYPYKFCVVNTINNNDGSLTCTRDQTAINAAQKQAEEAAAKKKAESAAEAKAKEAAAKAEAAEEAKQFAKAEADISKPAFESAAVIVMGRESKPGEVEQWVSLLKKEAGGAEKISEGLEFNDAVAFLKQFISKAEGASARAELIDNAFREVYGRRSTPAEQAFWDSQVKAQKTWYAPMVLAEIGKLNANPENRVIPLQTAYFLSFGRMPTAAEADYWKGRKEHFRPMIQANRNWLYSPDGAKDRQETIYRALKNNNNGKAPADDEVKKKLVEFTPDKLIYVEMIGKKISDFQ